MKLKLAKDLAIGDMYVDTDGRIKTVFSTGQEVNGESNSIEAVIGYIGPGAEIEERIYGARSIWAVLGNFYDHKVFVGHS